MNPRRKKGTEEAKKAIQSDIFYKNVNKKQTWKFNCEDSIEIKEQTQKREGIEIVFVIQTIYLG